MFSLICGTCLFIQVFSASSSAGPCSPEELSVFTNVRVNTGGDTGISSQRKKQAHLAGAFSKSLRNCTSVPETLSPMPTPFPILTGTGEKSAVMKRIWTVLIAQRQWQEHLLAPGRKFCSHHCTALTLAPNLSLASTFMRLIEMLSLLSPAFMRSAAAQCLSCTRQPAAIPLQLQRK